MSVFSKIKLSRKAAKEHKLKAAEAVKENPVTVPYKHIPTHAAVDALSGAPSSWKYEDLSKIKEHHKRRSQFVISRTHSSLSTTSYMNASGSQSMHAPPLPRAGSYTKHNPTWYHSDGDLYSLGESTHKRERVSRGISYQDPGIGPSPLATEVPSEAVSPVISSGNSTTSNSSDHLEISNADYRHARPQPVVYAENDILEQLHTSTTRKLGEAPLYDSPPVVPNLTLAAVAQEKKPAKSRWTLMGKKNAATIVV